MQEAVLLGQVGAEREHDIGLSGSNPDELGAERGHCGLTGKTRADSRLECGITGFVLRYVQAPTPIEGGREATFPWPFGYTGFVAHPTFPEKIVSSGGNNDMPSAKAEPGTTTMSSLPAHIDRLTRCCSNASITRFLKAQIVVEKPGVARVSVPFHPDLTQNSDFLHGAILFEAADTAGFVAANSLEETYSVLTVDYHINFMRPVQREGIYAVGEVIQSGKTLMVVRSLVYTDSGKLVASGQGTYLVTKILLTDLPGYAKP